jgi:hypothetical protein
MDVGILRNRNGSGKEPDMMQEHVLKMRGCRGGIKRHGMVRDDVNAQ